MFFSVSCRAKKICKEKEWFLLSDFCRSMGSMSTFVARVCSAVWEWTVLQVSDTKAPPYPLLVFVTGANEKDRGITLTAGLCHCPAIINISISLTVIIAYRGQQWTEQRVIVSEHFCNEVFLVIPMLYW